LGLALLTTSIGCLNSGKTDDLLSIDPEARNALALNSQGKGQLPKPNTLATNRPAIFDPKQTGGNGVNMRDSFARTTPMENRPALPAPQSDKEIAQASYNTPLPTGQNILPTQEIATSRAAATLPIPKLDLPSEPPLTRGQPVSLGQPGRDAMPLPGGPMLPTAPVGLSDLPKPIVLDIESDNRPRPPLPPSSSSLSEGALPRLPSATDSPIPGTKAVPLPPADPIRPN